MRRSPTGRPVLRALADRVGILPAYVEQTGREVRHTKDATRVALLAALGLDGATEAAAARMLAILDREAEERLIAPVRVVRTGDGSARHVPVMLPRGEPMALEWSVDVETESGAPRARAGALRRTRGGRLALALPGTPGPGYHRLTVHLRRGTEERSAEQALIVVPPRCPTPRQRLGGGRGFGLCANLYAVRSDDDWGIGDLAHLRALIDWSADIGAEFVGVNPLHALRNRGTDLSPYSPLSRLFRNVLYIDVTAVPELAESEEARRMLASDGHRQALTEARALGHVDYERVLDLKWPLWKILHRAFLERHLGRDSERGRAYDRFLADGGQPLADFATFLVLEERLGRDRETWTAALRDPRSAETAAFRAVHRDEVGFHCWLQFELDRQLAAVAAQARARGLAVGVYQDLALGSAGDGSDRWAFPGLFVGGASLGAPPDAFLAAGQDWGLPPLDPRRLVADGYRYWIALVRAGLRHAGALRIDHVMGLFRQFWIPAGRPPAEGAYVRFPAEDLLGILALESGRAGALVVGEDLGTVPRGLPRVLARWGILSSRVLYFARSRRGAFHPSRRYPARSLVTANTHDLPTLAAFWQGADLVLHRRLGLIPNDKELRRQQAARARERAALLRRLVAEGLLPADDHTPGTAALAGAVHAFLRRTPAALVGLWLEDLTAEVEPVNIPGVGPERHPGWRRRMRLPLESLAGDAEVRVALGQGYRRPRSGRRPRGSRLIPPAPG